MQNKALIFFSRVHSPLGGSGVFLLLELDNNDWIIKGWSLGMDLLNWYLQNNARNANSDELIKCLPLA